MTKETYTIPVVSLIRLISDSKFCVKRAAPLLVMILTVMGIILPLNAFPTQESHSQSEFIQKLENAQRTKSPDQSGNITTETDSLFGPENVIFQSTIPSPSYLLSADLDGDGDLDVVSSSRVVGRLVWFENDNGQLSEAQIIEDISTPLDHVTTVDLNGDGLPEILARIEGDEQSGNHGIFVYENTGNGFKEKEIIIDDQIKRIGRILPMDVDNDEDQDLIFSYFRNEKQIVWFINANGSFKGPNFIKNRDSTEILYNLGAIDFNADGQKDLVASYYSLIYDENHELREERRWLAGFKRDSTGFDTSVVFIDTTYFTVSIQTVDIDRDGDEDLLTTSLSFEILLYENNGDKLDSPVVIDSVERVLEIEAVDLDNDNDYDLIAQTSGHNVSWYENVDLVYKRKGSITDRAGDRVEFELIDFKKDATPDYVGTMSREDNILIRYNEGGSFGTGKLVESNTAAGIYHVEIADVNRDDKKDVIAASRGDNSITYYLRNSDGFSSQHIIEQSSDSILVIEMADLDGDSDKDLIVGSSSGEFSSLSWYEQVSTGFTTKKVIDDSLDTKLFLKAEDMTKDGQTDIVLRSGYKLMLYENSGIGFNEPVYIHQNLRYHFVKNIDERFDIADINQDGYKDIIAIKNYELIYIKGRETGFGEPQLINESGVFFNVATSDIDSDGDMDLVVGFEGGVDHYEKHFLIYENKSGKLEESESFALWDYTGSGIANFILEDLNFDGYEEVIVSGNDTRETYWNENDYIYWVENTSSGFQGVNEITNRAYGKGEFVAHDVDNDGDKDLIAVSSEHSKLMWFENKRVNTALSDKIDQPDKLILKSNYPNPFNPTTTIRFSLPTPSNVQLSIYDMLGRQVAILIDGKRSAGNHSINFDASDLSSGIYIYRLNANGLSQSRKMLLVK